MLSRFLIIQIKKVKTKFCKININPTNTLIFMLSKILVYGNSTNKNYSIHQVKIKLLLTLKYKPL